MMNRIFLSQETDPYYNVALEYQLLEEAQDNTTLFLWQNSPAVIFGRNQSLFTEVDTNYLLKNNICPVRRFSGGGAVFQDLGNLNFTFITKEKNANPKKYLKTLHKALLFLNIECEFSGRNDLLCNGKKFSGHAYFINDDNYLYHGTLMIDVNLDMLTNVLKPSFLKLNSKGINSVRSRVINLSQINKTITKEKIIDNIIEAFKDLFGKCETIKYLNKNNCSAPMYSKIKTDEWIYKESPQFSISIEKKLNIGNVTISCDVEDGLIKQIKVQTDSLHIFDFSEFEKDMIGTIYKKDSIFDDLEKFIHDKFFKT